MDRVTRTVLETGIELKLPMQQYARLAEAASAQNISVPLLIQTAIQEWLDRQAKISRAYRLMDELAEGLGDSHPRTTPPTITTLTYMAEITHEPVLRR